MAFQNGLSTTVSEYWIFFFDTEVVLYVKLNFIFNFEKQL